MARTTSLMLMAVFIGSAAGAQMGPGGGGPPGGGRGGRGPGGFGGGAPRGEMRAPDPVRRDKFDKAVTAMFREADTNRDNFVTLDELQASIAAKRDVMIRARFQHVDRDNSGSIDFAEFTAWQAELGSVALSDAASGGRNARVASVIQPALGRDPADRVLGQLIEPLGSTVIIEADGNSDGKLTLEELIAYESKRFDAADKNHDGEISFDELRALRASDKGDEPMRGQ